MHNTAQVLVICGETAYVASCKNMKYEISYKYIYIEDFHVNPQMLTVVRKWKKIYTSYLQSDDPTFWCSSSSSDIYFLRVWRKFSFLDQLESFRKKETICLPSSDSFSVTQFWLKTFYWQCCFLFSPFCFKSASSWFCIFLWVSTYMKWGYIKLYFPFLAVF